MAVDVLPHRADPPLCRLIAPRSWWRRRLSNMSLASCWSRCPGSLPASPEPMRCCRCPLAGSQSVWGRAACTIRRICCGPSVFTRPACAWRVRGGAAPLVYAVFVVTRHRLQLAIAQPHPTPAVLGAHSHARQNGLLSSCSRLSASYANISEHTIIKCTQILAGPPPPPCLVYQRQSCVKCRLSTPMVTRRCSCYPLVARKPILLGGVAKECLCRH